MLPTRSSGQMARSGRVVLVVAVLGHYVVRHQVAENNYLLNDDISKKTGSLARLLCIWPENYAGFGPLASGVIMSQMVLVALERTEYAGQDDLPIVDLFGS